MTGARKPDAAALAAFRAVLGGKGYSDDPHDIAPWLKDWRELYQGGTVALLSPATTAEVQQVVALAAAHRVPLVPQGGNTSMVGGATPPEDGSALLLSLRRMNSIRALDVEARLATVEAGVILSTLHDAALARGLRFPLSLGAKGSATLGGLVSTNAGGTQVLRFGTMRRLVAGVEAVLPDGSLYEGLAALKKDNRGYDLTQLLVGSEGTLGIITAARLHLVGGIADRAVAWIGVTAPADALMLLRQMEAGSGNAIESFELVPDHSLQCVYTHIPATRPPLESAHPWNVLVEYVQTAPQGLTAAAALQALLVPALESGLARDAVIAASEAQAEAFWKLRDSISQAERASGPAMQHDISVPVEDMPRFMIEAAAQVEAAFPGVMASAFGHLGDGNVHFHVRAPAGVEAARWRAGQGKAASDFVYDLVTAAGGSISAEHGIGQMKRDVFARTGDFARLSALRAIKSGLDPLGIMNPGKLLGLAKSDAGQ